MKRKDSFTTQYLAWNEVPQRDRPSDAKFWDMTINPFTEGTEYHGWFDGYTCLECRATLVGGMGPSHEGSGLCRMRTSIASGGNRSHCTCAACF